MNLLTRQQAAERLGVNINTIDNERKAGRLAYIQRRPGGKVWITEQAIAEYLSRATHPALPEIRAVRDTFRKKRA
ncbi:MAG: helix-turn-helix domain-containing protein [Oscillospiraceae bacterium]|nr:helix-turn-helix domain-containing protein [Oscillospiraceae bacterium]